MSHSDELSGIQESPPEVPGLPPLSSQLLGSIDRNGPVWMMSMASTPTVCALFNKHNACNAARTRRAARPVDDAFHTIRNAPIQATFGPSLPKIRGAHYRGEGPRRKGLRKKDGSHETAD